MRRWIGICRWKDTWIRETYFIYLLQIPYIYGIYSYFDKRIVPNPLGDTKITCLLNPNAISCIMYWQLTEYAFFPSLMCDEAFLLNANVWNYQGSVAIWCHLRGENSHPIYYKVSFTDSSIYFYFPRFRLPKKGGMPDWQSQKDLKRCGQKSNLGDRWSFPQKIFPP